jgi:hypothetical protein
MATNTYEALDTKTLSSAAASITFTSIPQTYTDLVIVCNGSPASGASGIITINGDTSGSYSHIFLTGYSGGVASGKTVDVTPSNCFLGGNIIGIGNDSVWQLHFMNYSNTTTNKTVLSRLANSVGNDASVLLYRNTAAITSITIQPQNSINWNSGATFTMYGIAREGAAATTAKATGGTITYGVDYTYHVFTSGGTFTPSQALSCDYLVVAGGGGGGSGAGSLDNGGGGGAGGYRTAYAQAFASGTGYTVTVGSGGAANANGVNSSVIGGAISFSATGGGRGSQYASTPGNGGSGGGSSNTNAAFGTGNAGSYAPLEGNSGSAFQGYWAGGGGGASQPGTPNGGGGDGIYTTLGPIPQYYAGGGGGGFNSFADRKGLPGLGGGGNGADYAGQWFGVAQAGTANTGGGGGGGASQGASIPGGAGGSGIVIIRYAS